MFTSRVPLCASAAALAVVVAAPVVNCCGLVGTLAGLHGQQSGERVQRSAGGGMWYSADADSLRETVDGYLSSSSSAVHNKPIAMIVPHAGYSYSGPVAGRTYSTLVGFEYRRVVLLGLSHRVSLRGASLLNVDAYETPLGRIEVDTAARETLLSHPAVTERPSAHLNEHSTENQLPMLQRALGEFELIEMLVGELSDEQRTSLASAVRELMDEETLLVVSTDFAHYGPNYNYVPFVDSVSQRLRMLNDMAMQEIMEVDPPGWERFLHDSRSTICGHNPVALLLETLLPLEGIEGKRIAYATSGDLTGDFTNSVTYAGVVFWPIAAGLDENEQHTLLRVARSAVADHLDRGAPPTVYVESHELTPRLESLGAAFVTLRNANELRGCIGDMVAVRPLLQSVVENAYEASIDPRFLHAPVTRDELADLRIEVSVLTPIRRLLDPNAVRVGTHGLLLVQGENIGVLLPQIPVEEGWDREQFLAAVSLKAGLHPEAWSDSQTQLYRFSAQVFGEDEQLTTARPEREDDA